MSLNCLKNKEVSRHVNFIFPYIGYFQLINTFFSVLFATTHHQRHCEGGTTEVICLTNTVIAREERTKQSVQSKGRLLRLPYHYPFPIPRNDGNDWLRNDRRHQKKTIFAYYIKHFLLFLLIKETKTWIY